MFEDKAYRTLSNPGDYVPENPLAVGKVRAGKLLIRRTDVTFNIH
jgi:hypothetical protein